MELTKLDNHPEEALYNLHSEFKLLQEFWIATE